MRVSGETIGALLVLATGDPPETAPAPYRSLTEIRRLFADFPAPERCTAGASRKTYAEEHIRAVNDTDALDGLIAKRVALNSGQQRLTTVYSWPQESLYDFWGGA